MFSNLDTRELAQYIREGERATWPKLDRIRNQTAISRAFEDCTLILKERHLKRTSARPRSRLRAPG